MIRALLDCLFSSSRVGPLLLIFFIGLFFVLKIIIPDYNKLVCESFNQGCIVESNFLGIKNSKTVFKPSEIAKTDVVKDHHYRRKYGRRYTYSLVLIDKYNSKNVVFRNINSKYNADKLGADLLYCIRIQKYPCVIQKNFGM